MEPMREPTADEQIDLDILSLVLPVVPSLDEWRARAPEERAAR